MSEPFPRGVPLNKQYRNKGGAMRIVSVLLAVAALTWHTPVIGAGETSGQSGRGIQWMTNFDEALARGRAENKPVLLDFFNPN